MRGSACSLISNRQSKVDVTLMQEQANAGERDLVTIILPCLVSYIDGSMSTICSYRTDLPQIFGKMLGSTRRLGLKTRSFQQFPCFREGSDAG